MKGGLLIIGTTLFLMYNTYHDGKYVNLLLSYKKYYTIAMWGFMGMSLYLVMTKHPARSMEFVSHANQLLKSAPIDRNTINLLSPIFDMTSQRVSTAIPPTQKRMMRSGDAVTGKRCVSETKKKFVAANQNWRCGTCKCQLQAHYEVDHKIRLDRGGTNHVNNLVALCRSCHGEKTMMENL